MISGSNPRPTLPDKAVTLLLPYGGLFYAGAADFEEELPTADHTQQAVAVLILRGRKNVGSTFLNVLTRYHDALRKNGGQLILADVNDAVYEQLRRTGVLEIIGEENILPAQPLLLASLRAASRAGQSRLSEVEANSQSELE